MAREHGPDGSTVVAPARRVFLRTFGCRANQYDSESLRGLLLEAGVELVARPEDADTAVFNSCAVTSEAEADLRQGVRQAARRQPALKTVIMGCAAAIDRGTLRELPTVTDVVPGAELPVLARALGLNAEMVPARGAPQQTSRALLRIQDGCDEHCTFCATTLARGANRSRAIDALVVEAQRLAEHHAEIVLTGVHIGTYGRDLNGTLGDLVEALILHVPQARFRLSSVEATEVDAKLLELFSARDRLVPHLHAPLQSASDRVLKRMGRHWYTSATYRAAVERLVTKQPFALGADVIAGFPGEQEDDHTATVALIRDLPFSYLHVFSYSQRPGTAAERLGPPVDASRRAARSSELRELGAAKAVAYTHARVGQVAELVVIDGRHPVGLTEDYLTVQLPEELRARTPARLPARLAWDRGELWAIPESSAS